jgi:hypothetical protein
MFIAVAKCLLSRRVNRIAVLEWTRPPQRAQRSLFCNIHRMIDLSLRATTSSGAKPDDRQTLA